MLGTDCWVLSQLCYCGTWSDIFISRLCPSQSKVELWWTHLNAEAARSEGVTVRAAVLPLNPPLSSLIPDLGTHQTPSGSSS